MAPCLEGQIKSRMLFLDKVWFGLIQIFNFNNAMLSAKNSLEAVEVLKRYNRLSML